MTTASRLANVDGDYIKQALRLAMKRQRIAVDASIEHGDKRDVVNNKQSVYMLLDSIIAEAEIMEKFS